MIPKFIDLYKKVTPHKSGVPKLLSLDPGDTTGWSVWGEKEAGDNYPSLLECGQMFTTDIKQFARSFGDLLDFGPFDIVIYERYVIYEWKLSANIGSDVPTIQKIGFLVGHLSLMDIETHEQATAPVKGFVTNDKLKYWEFYQTAFRHANDSIRHALFYYLWGKNGSGTK